MNIVLGQVGNLDGKLFRLHISPILLLVADGAEEVYLPDDVEDKHRHVADCGGEGNDVAVGICGDH